MAQEAVDIQLVEAVPTDAAEILMVMQKIGEETDFLILDSEGLGVTVTQETASIENIYESPNHFMLLAKVTGKIVGVATVFGGEKRKVAHIGEFGISILVDYQNFGLGTMMTEEMIHWAKESGVIRRLELTVQKRNERAVHLYEKLGFQHEGIMKRGVKSLEGEFLDVYLMAMLID